MEEDKKTRILIGVIVGLLAITFINGAFYIFMLQSRMAKLEKEKQEQLKKQVETQNVSIEKPLIEEKSEETKEENVKKDSQKIKKKLPKKQEKKEVVDEYQEEIDNQEIEKIIDNTINEINQQGTEPKNNRNNDDE